MTAEAIQYNFQRMLRKNLGVAWMFANVMDQDSVAIVDPTTIKITLTKSFAPFDAVLPWLFIANPAIVQANDVGGDEGEAYLKDHEAGSGPYTIGKWEIGSSYQFDRWADYWWQPEGVTMVDSMIWQIIRESSTKRIAMETGEVQYGDTSRRRITSVFGMADSPSTTLPRSRRSRSSSITRLARPPMSMSARRFSRRLTMTPQSKHFPDSAK